jgi:hypothetical protein
MRQYLKLINELRKLIGRATGPLGKSAAAANSFLNSSLCQLPSTAGSGFGQPRGFHAERSSHRAVRTTTATSLAKEEKKQGNGGGQMRMGGVDEQEKIKPVEGGAAFACAL